VELGLSLHMPASGTRADVVVRAAGGTCLRDVTPFDDRVDKVSDICTFSVWTHVGHCDNTRK
jgi:hypothetical protein